MKQTRNRRKSAPQHPLGLMTLEQWQESAEDRNWTATDPRFRKLVTVVTNERVRAIDHAPLPTACVLTEQARYGIQMGFEAAISVLTKMGMAPEPAQPGPLDIEFPERLDGLHEAAHME